MFDGCTYCTPDLESLAISLSQPDHNLIIVLSIYRPPDGSLPEFLRLLHALFLELTCVHRRVELFVVGNINLDISIASTRRDEFLELCTQFGLTSHISTPSRYTLSTATTIDICLSNSRFIANCRTIEDGVSDHLPICCIKIMKKKTCLNPREKYRARNYKNYDNNTFARSLSQFNWGRFFVTVDVELCWEILLNQIQLHCDF